MASLVPVTPKPLTVKGYRLDTYQDMAQALNYVGGLTNPHDGTLNHHTISGVQTWWITIHSPSGTVSPNGYMGDWVVVENNAVAKIVKAADFDTLYSQS